MNEPDEQSWLAKAIVIGLGYGAIGILFALPSQHLTVWRLAAWITSAVIFIAQILHEYFKRGNSPLATAAHAAVAVAIGGLALAIGATIHSLIIPPPYHRSRFALALIIWPLVTGVPAFIGAWIGTEILRRVQAKWIQR